MLKLAVRLQQLKLRAEDRGATAVEYGLIVTLIAVAIIVGVSALGGSLNTLFSDVSKKITMPQ